MLSAQPTLWDQPDRRQAATGSGARVWERASFDPWFVLPSFLSFVSIRRSRRSLVQRPIPGFPRVPRGAPGVFHINSHSSLGEFWHKNRGYPYPKRRSFSLQPTAPNENVRLRRTRFMAAWELVADDENTSVSPWGIRPVFHNTSHHP